MFRTWKYETVGSAMARKNHSEHARVTAICVNLALDQIEADISKELEQAAHDRPT